MTRRAGRVVAVLAVAALLAAYAGWRLWLGSATVPPDAPLAEQCREVPSGAERLTLRAPDGRELGAAVVGPSTARVALVLRHGASQTICDWLPWAAAVEQDTGVRVLLFDRRGAGSSPGDPGLGSEPGDTAAAAARLRAEGADEVLLMGSSMGNSVTVSALPLLRPPACGLIAVSPVLTSSDRSGSLDATAPRAVPRNLWVTWETGSAGVASAAQALTAAVADGRALPVDTADHSIDLVTRHREVRDFLERAVASCGD